MDLLSQLEQIASKLQSLQDRHQILSAENLSLKSKIEELEAELNSKESAINNIKEQNKITKLAKGLSSKDDTAELQTELDGLIAEIDQCINLIKR